MKNLFIYIAIVSIFSFNSYSQKGRTSQISNKTEVTQKDPDTLFEVKSTLIRTIKSYHVKEIINMKFGGYMMTYEVTDMSLIHIYDLGPNNTRVITPRYGDVKQLSTSQMKSTKSFLKSAKLSELRFIKKNEIEPINTSIKFPYLKEELPEEIKELIKTYDNEEINNSKKYVYIHMIKTYERIAEKGYKSIEIFQKIGDAFFFDGEYSKAAKWYGELFEMTTNLESEYYDRYIFSLKTIGEKNKAKEIVKKRNQLLGIQ